MYRIIVMSGTEYAVKLNMDTEYSKEQEYAEIEQYVNEGYDVVLTANIEDYPNATIVDRENED